MGVCMASSSGGGGTPRLALPRTPGWGLAGWWVGAAVALASPTYPPTPTQPTNRC